MVKKLILYNKDESTGTYFFYKWLILINGIRIRIMIYYKVN
jgi:hypothetical protein